MKSWYSNSNDIEMKDGSKWKEYRVVFETDSKELKLRFGDDVNGNDCIPMQQVQVTTRCR